MSEDTLVIDLSHYQEGDIDFDAVAADGIVGVIFKATEGTSYLDDTFKDRKAAALNAGLEVSQYHFLKHTDTAAQMAWFYNCASPLPGERMVIDYEDAACTLDDLMSACQALQQIDPSLQITVYGANGFLGSQLKGKRNSYLAQFSLWVASYTSADEPTMTDLKATWPTWSLWQYSDDGTVMGITGSIDVNRFNGSIDACIDWMAPSLDPKPTPDTVPTVIITIDADQPVTIQISEGANVTIIP